MPRWTHGPVSSPGVMKGPLLVLLVLALCAELGECQGSLGSWPTGHGWQYPVRCCGCEHGRGLPSGSREGRKRPQFLQRARRQSPRGTLPHNSVLLCGNLQPALCPLSLGPCPCLTPAQSLRCYSCGTLSKFPSFMQCPTSKCNSDPTVCYTGNLTLPMGRGEFPASRVGG